MITSTHFHWVGFHYLSTFQQIERLFIALKTENVSILHKIMKKTINKMDIISISVMFHQL